MGIEYTVYKCWNHEDKNNVMYNLYKHDLGGDFYLATFRYLEDLKNYLTLLDIENGEVYFSNVLKKNNEE